MQMVYDCRRKRTEVWIILPETSAFPFDVRGQGELSLLPLISVIATRTLRFLLSIGRQTGMSSPWKILSVFSGQRDLRVDSEDSSLAS